MEESEAVAPELLPKTAAGRRLVVASDVGVR